MAVLHYTNLTAVNALVPQVPFTAASRPTDAQVIAFIESVALRIDAVLKNTGYVVPVITGASALALLNEACTWGALGLAQQARGTGVNVSVGDHGQPVKNIWTQMFDEWMKRLASPSDPFELPDAPRNDQMLKQPVDVESSFIDVLGIDPDTPSVSRTQVF